MKNVGAVDIPAGQIVGQCVGWPNPHVEIQWSATPPIGSAAPNSNSILRTTDSDGQVWFFGGAYPGANGTRIDGSFASAWGPGGYPNPNFSVYDLRDGGALVGQTYTYAVKYRPESPSTNSYTVTIDASHCGGSPTAPGVSLDAHPVTVVAGASTVLNWASSNTAACQATGAWSGPKDVLGMQTIDGITMSSTYGLACTNSGQSVSTQVAVAVVSPTPLPSPGPGTIVGACQWNNGRPRVVLVWSQDPPPGQGVANSNGLQKGDSYPSDPQRYWEFLTVAPTQYAYTDDTVVLNTQYQYRIKYRPDLPSLNTYGIYTSVANCGGPQVASGPLALFPTFQNLPPNVTAILSASGGDGTYTWEAPDGIITGSGQQIGVTYTNNSANPIFKTITLHSGAQTTTATVQVDGVQTLQDSIDLTAPGNRFVLIDGGADYTASTRGAMLTLSHGFAQVASSAVTVKLGNTLAEASAATPVPFQKQLTWDLCVALGSCPDGLYTAYAIFQAPGALSSPVVMDNITYVSQIARLGASVQINADAPSTSDRQVTLTLQHGFQNTGDTEVSMQIANSAATLDAAIPVAYAPTVSGWDLCAGSGPFCTNGPKLVYVRFCANTVCSTVVQDSIDLASEWQDWGVQISENAPSTPSSLVQLRLNPWFNKPGTQVLVSNRADFSDALAVPYADLVSWDICRGLNFCPSVATVYAQYRNTTDPSWPATTSPRYEDSITYLAGPTPAPSPGGILINGGAGSTRARIVSLRFFSPFGATSGGTMRPVNEGALDVHDQNLIAGEFHGGINTSQGPIARVAAGSASLTQNGTASELESGTVLPFSSTLGGWDLCGGAVDCPYGTYKVYVQYYAPAAPPAVLATRGAPGDRVSGVYYDTIVFAAPTPTPSPTPVPTTSGSPVPSGGPSAGTPTPSGPPGPPSGAAPFLQSLKEAFGNAQPVISPVSVASALVVAVSAVAALLPLVGPGLGAFLWQWFMGVLGLLPKRKKVWGTIYDANTKRPVPFAKVQLLDRNRRVLETRIADKDGRYGFLSTPESLLAQKVQIFILPSHTDYIFPSRTPASIDTFVYNNLYYGALIEVNDHTLINFDIPMDPAHPSAAPLLVKSPSIALGATVAAIADAGFWLGLVMVPLNFILNPNPFTFGTLCLFLGTASLRIFGISEHPYGTVRDITTGRPVPFALITLNDLTGKRVAFAVSDEQGRYFLVAQKGGYEVNVVTPASVVPLRQSKFTIQAKKGWITHELTV